MLLAALDQTIVATALPTVVADLEANAAAISARLDAIAGEQWDRPGRRSDGSSFTLATLSRYLVHDPIHHVWDVTR